ncbi:MAG: T9SS type A sorting domain-containing protein [Bacteroidota bacterium]
MKKSIYIITCTLAFMFLSMTKAEAIGYQIMSNYYLDSCSTMFFLVQANVSDPSLSVETSYGDGSKDTTGWLNNPSYVANNTYMYHHYAYRGTYTVKHVLIYTTTRVDSVIFTAHDTCQFITGKLFNDLNSDCVMNTGDANLGYTNYSNIEVDSNGVAIDTIHAGSYGYGYPLYTSLASTYRMKLLNTVPGYNVACPTTGIDTVDYTTALMPLTHGNFGLDCSGTAADLWVASTGIFHVANPAGYMFGYAGNNTCTATSGVVTLDVSPKVYVNPPDVYPTPSSIFANHIIWNVSNLSNATAPFYFYVGMQTFTSFIAGDTLINYLTITPTAGDLNPTDNSNTGYPTIFAALAPNNKMVYPLGNVSTGSKLTYTINFENVYPAVVKNVHILDTLSPYLDLSTLRILFTSAPATISVQKTPSGLNVLDFDFENINLTDSSQHYTRAGFVQYSIKTKLGSSLIGSGVTNRADIHFDYYTGILTNTVQNAITTLNVAQLIPSSKVIIYPNPVTNTVSIQIDNMDYHSLELVNSIGQTIMSQSIESTTTNLNIKTLPSGLYYIRLKGDAGVQVEKIEKL